MFYMPFDSPDQDESNGTSFIKNRSLTNNLSIIFSILENNKNYFFSYKIKLLILLIAFYSF